MNGIKRVCFILFACCFLSIFVSTSADIAYCTVWFDLKDFSDLRTAVSNQDEVGVQSIFERGEIEVSYSMSLKPSLDSGRSLLETLDQQYLLAFERDLEDVSDARLLIYYYSEGVADSEIYYWFSGWYISSLYRSDSKVDLPTHENADFILETVQGEELWFEKNPTRDFYMVHHQLPNGKWVSLCLAPASDTADISNPPIDKIGKLAFVPFAELTPATESSDLTPSGGENAPFPWLCIALPVGAVAIAGGAATFFLLRKKRKSSKIP